MCAAFAGTSSSICTLRSTPLDLQSTQCFSYEHAVVLRTRSNWQMVCGTLNALRRTGDQNVGTTPRLSIIIRTSRMYAQRGTGVLRHEGDELFSTHGIETDSGFTPDTITRLDVRLEPLRKEDTWRQQSRCQTPRLCKPIERPNTIQMLQDRSKSIE